MALQAKLSEDGLDALRKNMKSDAYWELASKRQVSGTVWNPKRKKGSKIFSGRGTISKRKTQNLKKAKTETLLSPR
jgi:hypothetical protein